MNFESILIQRTKKYKMKKIMLIAAFIKRDLFLSVKTRMMKNLLLQKGIIKYWGD